MKKNFIYKLMYLILIITVFFYMFGSLKCFARELPEVTMSQFKALGEPTPEYEVIMRTTYNILKVVMGICIFVNFIIIIVDLIENKIKTKKFRISTVWLNLFLIFISIFGTLIINSTMWEDFLYNNVDYIKNKLLFSIAQIILIGYMIFVVMSSVVDVIKCKIIHKKEKINWSYFILLIVTIILFCINKCFLIA